MDFMILDGIQKLHSPLLDTLFVCITRLGDKGFVWCLMALVFLLIPEKRKTGFICVAALLLTEITGNHILKPLFARVRPCDVNQAVQLLIANPGGYSFPSGHTSASFAAASVLRFREKRKVAVPALFKNVSLCTLSDGYCRRYSLGNTDGICLCTGCRQDKIQEKFNKHRKKMTLFYVSPVIIMKISANLSAEH